MEIGVKIYLGRRQKGLSQKELSARAGIPQPNLSNIEKGKQDVTVSTLQKIASALDMSMADFFREPAWLPTKVGKFFTRARLEKLAAAVVWGSERLSAEERSIVERLKQILPAKKRGTVQKRRVLDAWLSLKGELGDGVIRSLVARVRDAQTNT